jgi:hypothetical protein
MMMMRSGFGEKRSESESWLTPPRPDGWAEESQERRGEEWSFRGETGRP